MRLPFFLELQHAPTTSAITCAAVLCNREADSWDPPEPRTNNGPGRQAGSGTAQRQRTRLGVVGKQGGPGHLQSRPVTPLGYSGRVDGRARRHACIAALPLASDTRIRPVRPTVTQTRPNNTRCSSSPSSRPASRGYAVPFPDRTIRFDGALTAEIENRKRSSTKRERKTVWFFY